MFKKKQKFSELDYLKADLSENEIKTELSLMREDELKRLLELEKHVRLIISFQHLRKVRGKDLKIDFIGLAAQNRYRLHFENKIEINKITSL